MNGTTRLQPRGPGLGFPPMWIVYERPSDFPEHRFVVRLWYGMHRTSECEGFDSIVTARERLIEIGASARLARMPGDDPAIYEVWL